MANVLHAKAGGWPDVSASLVGALFRQGADVHVALPHYRKMFHVDVGKLISDELRVYMSHLHNSRIHLAEDRIFYYRDSVYSSYSKDSFLQAMAFQREVINNIIPDVKPDLIHCNDWMTGSSRPLPGGWGFHASSRCTTSTPTRRRWPRSKTAASTRRRSGRISITSARR